jgi:hypothetical protein
LGQVSRKKRNVRVREEEQLTFSRRWIGDAPAQVREPSNVSVFVRRNGPKPSPVFSTYWRFAKLRQELFFARIFKRQYRNVPFDPILERYRFTNTYRASDRVSQFLIKHVLYDRDWSPADLLFRLLVFKFFNKVETWQALSASVGEITWVNYDFDAYDRCLTALMAAGTRIYSAAYIMPAGQEAFGHQRKHRNHLRIVEKMIRDKVHERIAEAGTLSRVFHLLRHYPCIGPFVGFQFAIDVNYSVLTDFSENDFVEAGPGALDGIAKCFSDLGDYTPADIIRYMMDIQDDAFEQFAPGFENLWGRRLHLIDCQNIFCEVSKYSRVAHPEIVGISQRTRIKQNYRAAAVPFERPWYPPKWNLNGAIAADTRLAV